MGGAATRSRRRSIEDGEGVEGGSVLVYVAFDATAKATPRGRGGSEATRRRRPCRHGTLSPVHSLTLRLVGVLAAAAAATSCSLIVDVGDLARDDGGQADADVSPDGDADAGPDADADVGPDADADVGPDADADVGPDADADVGPDADAEDVEDLATETDADADADADADGGGDADADADTDADADADADADVSDVLDGADATVGPPARVWGEMTASGAPADGAGCVARGTGVCLRSDTVDSSAQVLAGGGFRLRGIVVQGGAR
jgi:hypothetical protein